MSYIAYAALAAFGAIVLTGIAVQVRNARRERRRKRAIPAPRRLDRFTDAEIARAIVAAGEKLRRPE